VFETLLSLSLFIFPLILEKPTVSFEKGFQTLLSKGESGETRYFVLIISLDEYTVLFQVRDSIFFFDSTNLF